MSSNLGKAIELLHNEDYTCVLCNDDATYTSKERGVKPLLQWIDTGIEGENLAAADKVVGKAAAFLYVQLGVTEVYADVISKPAIEVLREYGVTASWKVETEMIINRAGTGFCPMEEATKECRTSKEALEAILAKLKQLQKNQ